MSYKVEIIEEQDPIKQLEASKSSIKDLLSDLLNETKDSKSDLLNETKDSKYQKTLKVTLKKCRPNGEIEF